MKKKILAVLLVVSLVLGLTACTLTKSKDDNKPDNEKTNEEDGKDDGKDDVASEEVLTIGVLKSVEMIPLLVMQDQKYDYANGIKVEIKTFDSELDRDAALKEGTIDGVFTDMVSVCGYQGGGLDVRITGCTDGDYLLISGGDTRILEMKQAEGASVAISENSFMEYVVDYLLAQADHTPDYLKKQVVDSIANRIAMLGGGQVDMCLFNDPYAKEAILDNGNIISSANDNGLFLTVSAFSKKVIDTKKAALVSFYRAYDSAVEYINQTDVEKLEDLIIKGAGYPEDLRGHIELPKYREHCLPEEESFIDVLDFCVAKGLCNADLTFGECVYDLQ